MTATKKPSSKPDGKKKGRPSAYTIKLATVICNRIADGESLRKICVSESMPNKSMVFRWLESHKEFRDQYARAREQQADALFDECLDIADEVVNDTYLDSSGNERTDNEAIQRSKLRIDTRKWIAGKLRPKVYGDKQSDESGETVSAAEALRQLADRLPD